MIIHSPKFISADGLNEISALIEFDARSESKHRNSKSPLWFRFRETEGISPRAHSDPFAVALLLVAMQANEPLEIRGSISRALLKGLGEYQRKYHSWFPERFHVVDIRADEIRNDEPLAPSGSGLAFSGGVDSFYTLLSLVDRPPSHALFMAGFDMPLNLKESIGELTRSYTSLMEGYGIPLIVGSTNVRAFVNSVDWTNAHGQALAASALFFSDHWKYFYVPSSYTLESYPKWGTHPELDHLLSTESMRFKHHGANSNRVEKLKLIARSPETYARLRVCWIQDIGLRNCGECEKCVRTMVSLELLGALKKYTTFPKSGLSRRKIRALPQRTYQGRLFAKELMSEAVKRRRPGLWFDLGYSLIKRKLRHSLLALTLVFSLIPSLAHSKSGDDIVGDTFRELSQVKLLSWLTGDPKCTALLAQEARRRNASLRDVLVGLGSFKNPGFFATQPGSLFAGNFLSYQDLVQLPDGTLELTLLMASQPSMKPVEITWTVLFKFENLVFGGVESGNRIVLFTRGKDVRWKQHHYLPSLGVLDFPLSGALGALFQGFLKNDRLDRDTDFVLLPFPDAEGVARALEKLQGKVPIVHPSHP